MTSESPIRVLIVEDDLRISELHRRFTERIDGFEVVGIANTLADAEEMTEVLAPDLVLLDLFFPEGNGLDLLRRLRAGAIPTDVILITAAREMTSLKEALRGGVFDYIIKPVFLPRFQEALHKYREYFANTRAGGTLDQKDVDRLLRPHVRPSERGSANAKRHRSADAAQSAPGLCRSFRRHLQRRGGCRTGRRESLHCPPLPRAPCKRRVSCCRTPLRCRRPPGTALFSSFLTAAALSELCCALRPDNPFGAGSGFFPRSRRPPMATREQNDHNHHRELKNLYVPNIYLRFLALYGALMSGQKSF